MNDTIYTKYQFRESRTNNLLVSRKTLWKYTLLMEQNVSPGLLNRYNSMIYLREWNVLCYDS